MIAGKSITLASIDGVSPEETAKVLDHCTKIFPHFDRVVMFSFRRPEIPYAGGFVEIYKLSYPGYAHFSIRELPRLIDTDFVLTVHPDGYILNPEKWRDEFLEHDYIGAPWPEKDRQFGGNSGFCLRSSDFLLDSCSCPYPYRGEHDDEYFFKTNPSWFSSAKIAPREIAQKFSVECDMTEPEENVFGFHQFIDPPSRRRPLP